MPKLSEITIQIKADALKYREGLKSAVEESKLRVQQMRESMMGLKSANADAGESTVALGGKLKNMFGEVVGNIARFTAYYLAVGALKDAVGGAITEFRKFDEALRNIQSITLQSDAEMVTLGKDILGMVLSGQSAGETASNIADAMYELVSAGYSTAEALDIARVAAVGAAAGLSDTATVSKLLLGILQSYSLPASEAANVMNQLFTIVDLGVVHFDQLATGMGMVIPTASALGIPLNEVGASIELLTRQGQQPARVMTNLNDAMTRLLKPNKDLLEVIRGLGYASGSTMVAQLGWIGTLDALQNAAQDTSKALDDQREATDKLKISQESADLAVADSKDRVKDALDRYHDAQKAAQGTFKTDQERAKAQRAVGQAWRDYQKSLIDVRSAELKAKDAGDAMAKGLKDQAIGVDTADDKLAKWFGDVRAIRAIFGLTKNDGDDLNQMMADHNKVAGEGGRQDKALVEQQKSLNYQLHQFTSNIFAFTSALIGFAGSQLSGPLTSMLKFINSLFTYLGHFDQVTKHWVFFWEGSPKWMKIMKDVFFAIIVFLSATAIPIIAAVVGMFIQLIGALGAFALFSNPLALVIMGVILLLKYTGHLGDAWNLVKRVVKAAVSEILADVSTFVHFLSAGLSGGQIGGEHSLFEKVAFGLGKAMRDALPHIKAFMSEVGKLGHLLVSGFSGNQIGGEFSKVEKAAFRTGQIIRQVLDYVKAKVIPWALKEIVANAENVWAMFKKVYEIAEELSRSPSFRAFLNYLWDVLKRVASKVADLVSKLVEFVHSPVGEFIRKLVSKFLEFAGVILVMASPIGTFIQALLAVAIVFKVIDWLVKLFHDVKDAVNDAWTKVKDFVNDLLEKGGSIVGWVTGLPGKFAEALGGLAQTLSDMAVTLYNSALDIGKSIANGIVDGIKGIAGSIGDIASSIEEGLKAAMNEALRWANSNLHVHIGKIGKGKFSVDFGDINFPLVQLANGVRDFMGGLALIGENGPELAVLPRGASVATAPKTSQILDHLQSGGGGVNVMADFNVQVQTYEEIKKKLYGEVDKLDRQLRYRAQRGGANLNGQLVR